MLLKETDGMSAVRKLAAKPASESLPSKQVKRDRVEAMAGLSARSIAGGGIVSTPPFVTKSTWAPVADRRRLFEFAPGGRQRDQGEE